VNAQMDPEVTQHHPSLAAQPLLIFTTFSVGAA
jgi:hypothetical protein